MKRLTLFFIALVISVVSWAQNDLVAIDDFYYELDSEAKTAGLYGQKQFYIINVAIPSIVTYEDVEYTVTRICDYAFLGNSTITSVKIPNSIISIGAQAFYGCI